MTIQSAWKAFTGNQPHYFVVILLPLLSVVPALMNTLGIDFSSAAIPLDLSLADTEVQPVDAQFMALKGAIHHALLEWSAVGIAAIGGLLAFLHYRRFSDVTVGILGAGLICTALMDAFHSLAAIRIIVPATHNADFIPFTWALSRCFCAALIIIAVFTNLWITRQTIKGKYWEDFLAQKKRILARITILFFALTIFAIIVAQQSTGLPQTTFPQALVTRPFDVLPLAMFVLAATIAWLWQSQQKSFIAFAVLLSLIPQMVAQLHMSFGATQLYGNHFNIAHLLKILAYSCIAVALLLDKLSSPAARTPSKFSKPITNKSGAITNLPVKGLIDVGYPVLPQTLIIPASMFVLAVTLTILVGSSFYLDSAKLVKQQELKKLEAETNLVSPLIKALYEQTSSDVLFLSQTPAVQGIISALERNDAKDLESLKKRLNGIFTQRLASQESYIQVRYIGVADDGKEIVKVTRSNGLIQEVPQSRLQQKGQTEYVRDTINLLPGQMYYSKIEYNREFGKISLPYQPVLRVATPIYSDRAGEIFGVIVVNVDFSEFLNSIKNLSSNEFQIFIANEEGDYLLHPDDQHTFGFDLGRRFLMQEEFPQLRKAIKNNEHEFTLESLAGVKTDSGFSHRIVGDTGFYRLIRLDEFGSDRKLRLLLTVDDTPLQLNLSNYRNRSILLGLALTIIALALAVLVSRRVVAPLNQTIQALEHLEHTGELKPLPLDCRDEIGVLARRFHNLLTQQKLDGQAIDDQRFAMDQHAIVGVTDMKGTITYVNHKFCEISGYEEEELIGANHRLIKSGAHDEEFFRNMFLCISKGKVWHNQICNRKKTGELYWVDTTIVPFLDEEGKPRSYVSLRTDITEQKQIEMELTHAKEDAEQAAQAKSDFLASMSHEIRTPMNGVLGMLNLLSKSSLTNEQMRRLALAQGSAQSLLTLINDILDFSKVEAGKLDLEYIDFNVKKLLGDFSEAMALRAQEKEVELILDASQVQLSHAKGDPGRLRQILTNLVGNAIKFTEQGEIVIRSSLIDIGPFGLIFTCKVIDSGIGIPAEKIDSLFETFTQVDSSTTRKFGGTGLGLSIVKKLCELMQGSVAVSSVVGKGSCFEFAVCLERSEVKEQTIPPLDMKNLRLLVVDDNATNREVLSEQLRVWGATVEEAVDGESTLELLQSYHRDNKPLFDVAFLDMKMPGMNGAELARHLQQDPNFSAIKLVMMTSLSQRGDAQWFAKLGFSAYFPKPATPSDLFDALCVVVNGGSVMHQASPLVTRHYVRSLTRPDVGETESTSLEWSRNTRVLLVEDNRINQEVALGQLDDIGLTADVAANGSEAIIALKQAPKDAPYTLLLMDCQMPVLDGFAATKKIRSGCAGPSYVDIPIIAMTANAMKGDREKCLEAGMSDYVSKPIDHEQLLEKLRCWIDMEERVATDSEHSTDTSAPQVEVSSAVWDVSTALKRVGGKDDRLNQLIDLYFKYMPERISSLEAAIQESDLDSVIAAAHDIKGVVGNLSSEAAMQAAFILEQAGRDNDKALMDKVLPEFLQVYAELNHQLTEYRGRSTL